jgi:tRNA threonylcarbamoyladenosine biosynthesis protein TsaB
MKILALDCSTQACSVALLETHNTERPDIVERFELAARQHTQRLLPMVDELLAATQTSLQQLDAIAFGRGPGSFTGLRICIGAVQGLAFGADLPVLPVSSLAAQAQAAVMQAGQLELSNSEHGLAATSLICSTIDARMNEIYWAVYKQIAGLVEVVDKEYLTAPEQVLSAADSNMTAGIAIGGGYHYLQRLPASVQSLAWNQDVLPRASAVALLGLEDHLHNKGCSAQDALPIYLRDKVAWQKQPLA